MQWSVGKVKITKIVELETVGSTRFILPLATRSARPASAIGFTESLKTAILSLSLL